MAVLYQTPLFNDTTLQAYWQFEGNSADSKGTFTGTDANISYGAAFGKFAQGAVFNGSNSQIAIGTALNLSNTSFSIVGWLNLQGTSAGMTLYAQRNSNNTDRNMQFYIQNGTQLNLQFFNDDLAGTVAYAGTAQYVHVGVTFNSSTRLQTIWQNGVIVGTRTAGAVLNIDGSTILGNQFGANFLNGWGDDWAVFYRDLQQVDFNYLVSGGHQMSMRKSW